MPQTQMQTMTLDEECALMTKAHELLVAGKEAESNLLLKKQYPMPPYLAQFAKSHFGADFLINGGWNLSEAEAEFGSDWLYR
jgi:hypothetical protein